MTQFTITFTPIEREFIISAIEDVATDFHGEYAYETRKIAKALLEQTFGKTLPAYLDFLGEC